jgi:hypothetical protein
MKDINAISDKKKEAEMKFKNKINDLIKNYSKNLEHIGNKLSDFEEIPNKDKNYTILGKGNFGYVEKMKSKKNNSIYAIKKLNINYEEFTSKNFYREIEIMINLKHDNIIRLYGFFEDIEKINKYNEINLINQDIKKIMIYKFIV